MKITDEIKTKVIAQYIGQRMLSGHYLIGICFGDKEERPLLLSEKQNSTQLDWEATFEMDSLLLKPLSSITDEDAIEVAKIEGFIDGKNYSLLLIGLSRIKSLERNQLDMNWKAYQYLQSKGYDMPNYLLGGKTLQESGLAIYE